MSHCTDEDKGVVRDKTDKLLQRYSKLRDEAKNLKRQADDAAKVSKEFFDTKDELITWCDDTVSELEATKNEGERVQKEKLKVCT